MALAPIFKKAYWSLAAAGLVYFAFVSLLLNGTIQRLAIYAHIFHTGYWQSPNNPEQFGFLKNQVQPFTIPTPDGETLYGWHILPLALYTKHERALLGEYGYANFHREFLKQDSNARLVINFHGNAGNIAQGWRTDTYRAVTAGASEITHVISIDYRGFGLSTGSPTEQGLIIDGVTVAKWAMDTLGVPPERIVLLGQSLGTAVATAVAERMVADLGIEFKGIILVAGFSDIPTLMLTYAIGGIIPILSPLKPYPKFQSFFKGKIQETWFTADRLRNLARRSKAMNLFLIHAKNDFDIPWQHCDTLFYAAANATSAQGMTLKQIDSVKKHKDLGEAGYVNTWTAGVGETGMTKIRQEIVKRGGKSDLIGRIVKVFLEGLTVAGHNRIPSYPVVAKAVLNAFAT